MPTRHLETREIEKQLNWAGIGSKEIKKSVYELFAAYRKCRILLRGLEFTPHEAFQVKPGYEDADDPSSIRSQHFGSQRPRLFSGPNGDVDLLSEREMSWLRFVWRIDGRVNALPKYQSMLIRYRFLDNEPVPSDDETHQH